MHSSESGSGTAEMFGALLRFFREKAGLTQEELGRRVGYSKSQVAMVERGERPPKGEFAPMADDAVGAQGALIAAVVKLRLSHLPTWTKEYAEEEARAAALHTYANHVMPGLLQTEAYARAVFNCNYCPPLDDEEIEAQVATRLARQQVLRRKPAPVVSFVLEQAVLTRPLGGPQALQEQLHHVLDVSRMRNVEIQVMSHDRQTHAGLAGPMILLESSEHRQLAYVESQSGGYFVSEQPKLGSLFGKYGILRGQALTPEESAKLVEQVAHSL